MTRSKGVRWSATRKREVAFEIVSGARTKDEVRADNPDISEEELDGWIAAYQRNNGSVNGMGMAAMIRARKSAELV